VTRRNARHDFPLDTGGNAGLGFLSATAENERVTTFQSDYLLARKCPLDHEAFYLRLRQPLGRSRQPDKNALAMSATELDDVRIDQCIIDQNIASFQELIGLDGQQLRRARTCANEKNFASVFHYLSKLRIRID
jgi:hypothetical protein